MKLQAQLRDWKIRSLGLLALAFVLASPSVPLHAAATSAAAPNPTPPASAEKPKKDKAQRFESSAATLERDAQRLEKRLASMPESQKKAAEALIAAKRDLAKLKTQAAGVSRQNQDQIPDDLKAKLRDAQDHHADALADYAKIGRDIRRQKTANKSLATAQPSK
ncbi:MAG: hypothetical protein JO317_04825 [Verrucomicrobiae bacterium]|nr:hypothetical protein [Verrucomicrobiae bacterium]